MSTIAAIATNMGGTAGRGRSAKSSGVRQQYINNMVIEESLSLLPAAVDHPDMPGFMAYLREHLPQNSAITRLKYAEYIAYRYGAGGRMNLALARFLKYCPNDRARREVLWFETVSAMPPLRELCEAWLATLPEAGVPRQHLLDYLSPRIGERKADKIAKEAVGAIRKLGHLRSPKPAVYEPVWTEPAAEVLVYVLARLYAAPTVVRMEAFKSDPLWRALLWPAGAMERLVLEGERTGVVGAVTKLDKYYQFALDGSGEERLSALLAKWGPEPEGAS